ncbi:MAG: acyl-CoA dehydrogenase family protein, partial [Candidatus Dormibacteria bacterium]
IRPGGVDLRLPWCLTDEHHAWRGTIRDFAERVIAPSALERNVDARFDASIMAGLGRLGVYGSLLRTSPAAAGSDMRAYCLTIEELARVDSGVAASAHVQTITTALFEHLAGEGQRHPLLEEMASGRSFVSFGLTEASGGSDAGSIATRARREGDGWVISGSKEFITNLGTPFSRHVILFAASGDGDRSGRPAVSAFLVPLDAPGVSVGASYRKLGWRTSDTHPLYLDGVRLPADALLGEEGTGYREALRFLTWARMPMAAMSTGLAQGCLEATLDFVGSRTSFDRPLGAHQGVAFGVAEIAAKTATARLVTYDACYRYDHGLAYEQEAAICKLVASELANQVAYLATQLHGGLGFVDDSAVTRHYADARILTIGEGTSEIQRLLIARSLGLPL